jgi:hypothetical protein
MTPFFLAVIHGGLKLALAAVAGRRIELDEHSSRVALGQSELVLVGKGEDI